MASKMVRDRQNSAVLVLAVEAAQGAVLQRGLERNAAEDAPPHAQALRAALRATLEAATKDMVRTDEAHAAELADDPAARDERDAAFTALRAQLIDVRMALSGYPEAVLEGVFQRRPTPTEPRALERYAGAVATALTATQLPEVARTPGITLSLDVQATAASLRDSRDRLTAALAAVAREVREAQSTRSARDEAMARYDRVFRSYASMLVMLFELAGKPDLADHVRPSTRRPGQTRDAAAGRDVSLDEVLRTDDAEGENATPPTATA